MAKIIGKEKNVVSIELEISKEKFEESIQKAYVKTRGKINIPGFRKGKAPRKIIEINYGKSVFYEDAIDIALPDLYEAALNDLDIDPINKPRIDVKDIEEGQDIVVIAEIEVMPEVKLAEIETVEAEKASYLVTDEEIDSEIKRMQEQNARIITIEDRSVELGDTVVIDYEGFLGEEQFEGGTAQNHSLEIGSNSFIPGFEEGLIGKNANDVVDVNVIFPTEYHSDDLAGKEVVFKVKINEIKSKELPELDDEFAKDISEFDTIAELIADTKANMIKRAKDSEKIADQNSAVLAYVEACITEVPEILVDREIDYQIKNFEQQISKQGMDIKDYYNMIGANLEDLKNNIRPQAEVSAKTELVINSLINDKKFEVSDEEINEELEKLAKSYKIEQEDKLVEFKENLKEKSLEYITDTIQRKKAIDYIVDNVKLIEKKETTEVKVDSLEE